MPNTSSDNLVELIKSLTKVEKKHFRLYVSRNAVADDALYMRLFDILCRLERYDEKIILQREQEIRKSQLPNLKAHLYEELLTSLRLQHGSRTLDISIREQIDYTRLLYNRGLIRQALQVLDKAKAIAIRNSHFILSLEILQFENMIEARHITRSIEGRAASLQQQTTEISGYVQEVTKLSGISLGLYSWYLTHGHVRSQAQSEEIAETFRKQMEDINEQQVSSFGKAYLQQAYCWYYYIQLDYPNYYRHAAKWVAVCNAEAHTLKDDPLMYLKALHNYATALFNLRKVTELEHIVFIMDRFRYINGRLHPSMDVQAAIYIYMARLNLIFIQGRFSDNQYLLAEVNAFMLLNNAYIDNHRNMVLNYKLASLCFGSGNHSACVSHLSRIINDKHGSLRGDIQGFARVLYLLAHFELENYELLTYLVKSVYRFFARIPSPDQVQLEILYFLKQMLRANPHELNPHFQKFRDRLLHVSAGRFVKPSSQYLDIISWLESKLERRKVEEVIQEKFFKISL